MPQRVAGGFNVRPHRRGRPVPVAVPHGGGDLGVIAGGLAGPRRVSQGIGRKEQQPPGLVDRRFQPRAARGDSDRTVEGAVGGAERGGAGRPVPPPDGLLDGRQVGLVPAPGRQAGRVSLDRDPVVDDVLKISEVLPHPAQPATARLRQPGDERSAARPAAGHQVPLLLQLGQRVTQ